MKRMKSVKGYGKKTIEWCPNCNTEVRLNVKDALQLCPNCGFEMSPCNYCMDGQDCTGCINGSRYVMYTPEISKTYEAFGVHAGVDSVWDGTI